MTKEELIAAIKAEQAAKSGGVGKVPIKKGHVPKVVSALRGGGPPKLDPSGYIASHKYGDYGFDPTGPQGTEALSLADALQFYNNLINLGEEGTTQAAMGGRAGQFRKPADTEIRRFQQMDIGEPVKRKRGTPLVTEFTTPPPVAAVTPSDLENMSVEELEALKRQIEGAQ